MDSADAPDLASADAFVDLCTEYMYDASDTPLLTVAEVAFVISCSVWYVSRSGGLAPTRVTLLLTRLETVTYIWHVPTLTLYHSRYFL